MAATRAVSCEKHVDHAARGERDGERKVDRRDAEEAQVGVCGMGRWYVQSR